MQDIEKNMDDLFRKAVENYQLNPGESNWDKITSKLSTNPAVPPEVKEKNNIKKYFLRLLFILLFLLAGGLLTKYNEEKNRIPVLYSPLKTKINNPAKEQSKIDRLNVSSQKESKDIQVAFEKDNSVKENYRHASYNSPLIKKSKYDGSIVVKNKESPLLNKDDANSQAPVLMNQYNPAVLIQNKFLTKKKGNEDDNSPKVVKPVLKNRGIYLGAAIGVSLNSVKYQGFTKPGFDIGVIGGYQFNNKISVETGLFFGKKYYYTDGKYFSMDKVGSSMPREMKIVSLEGRSTLFEVPIKFKYNFLHKNKATISSSAGLSSYLLTNEKNNYLTSMNGTRENIISSYENSSRYFAAAVDFSLIYEHKFSHNKNIRIEPYVQFPLKGIGMGTLPVISMGLHVGFTVSPSR